MEDIALIAERKNIFKELTDIYKHPGITHCD